MTEIEFETPEAAAAFDLMMRLFEDRINRAEMSQLDLSLRQDASVRRLFIRVAHQYCALVPFIAMRGATESSSTRDNSRDDALIACQERAGEPAEESAQARRLLSETMILPALKEMDTPEENRNETDIFQPAPFQPEHLRNPPRNIHRRWYRIAMVLVLALLVTTAVVLTNHNRETLKRAQDHAIAAPRATAPVISPEPAWAVITATAGAIGDGIQPIDPKTELVPNRNFKLAAGDIEITFATGAKVVVRGPAQARVTDRNTLTVDTGAVYAHVPPSATGFRILAPGLAAVDRGTNFGVRITSGSAAGGGSAAGNSTSEVHVFAGHVDATALDGTGNPSGVPLSVKAGDAVAHSASEPNNPLMPVRFQASAFDPDISRIQLDVPSHGTGAGVNQGAPDPQWQLVSVPNATDWKTVPAVVVIDPRPEYAPNSAKAKWISTSAHMDPVAGGNYVYRTTIDLTDYNPASVSVVANFAVDDNIREIRVNGQSASLPKELTMGLDGGAARETLHQLPLSGVKWVSGPNQVDVVVWNLEGYTNYTGLQLGWTVLAAPIVKR